MKVECLCVGGRMDGARYAFSSEHQPPDVLGFEGPRDEHGRRVVDEYRLLRTSHFEAVTVLAFEFNGQVVDTTERKDTP